MCCCFTNQFEIPQGRIINQFVGNELGLCQMFSIGLDLFRESRHVVQVKAPLALPFPSSDIPADVAQQLLDELAASMGANVIRTTPLAYLRGLIARAGEGKFMAEGALRSADRSNRCAAVDAALCRNQTGRRGDHPSLVVDTDAPLIRRLLDMQSKSQEENQGLD